MFDRYWLRSNEECTDDVCDWADDLFFIEERIMLSFLGVYTPDC